MRAQVAEGTMCSDAVVVMTIVISQELGLGDRGEQLTVQEFVAQS